MAKQYVINFSRSEEIVEFADDKKSVKVLEIKMLTNLFQIAMDAQTLMTKTFECNDCIDALKSLKDDDFSINFTKQDLNYLEDAFAKTAEKRPSWWFDKCSQIFEQITKPEEK